MEPRVLAGLQPQAVWEIFEGITGVPRCSGKEQRIRAWVKEWAGRRGIGCREDQTGNLLLRREATEGRGQAPVLVLQAHMDMVCAKTADCPVDFDRDPIPVRVRGEVVASQGTTLGADNGIGVALALAALEDPSLRRGPLEVLLTVGEEVGFVGAFGLEPGFFTGKYLLNLDSEELGLITIGTAGGEYTDYVVPATFRQAARSRAVRLSVEGLAGGHSGIHIHLPRLNAIRLIVQALEELGKATELRISSLEGGMATNAIPASAACTFLVPVERAGEVLQRLRDWRERIFRESREKEPGMRIEVAEAGQTRAASRGQTEALLGLLRELPHGPLAFSKEIEGLVETSNNLALVRSGGKAFEVSLMCRSSVDSELESLSKRLRQIGERQVARVRQHDRYPGWTADPGCRFNALVKQEYEAVLGRPAQLKAYHFGLECGVFKGLDPDLRMASIGPTIQGVHSTEECVEIASVGVVWQVIRRVIEGMERLGAA
jgi:dipeptidase D